MKTTLFTAAIAACLTTTAHSAIIQRRSKDLTTTWIPPDLYVSPEPVYAGSPIIMKEATDSTIRTSLSSSSPYAITYTPYTSTGDCKTATQVSSDILSIARKGFSAIQLYATDCNALPHVSSAAKRHSLHLILGIYIDASGTTSAIVAEQLRTITTWATISPTHWKMVDLIIAGNEALFNDFASPADLAAFLTYVRTTLREAGYDGPVSTAEPTSTLTQNADTLCSAIDVLAPNLHPFFHADVSAEDAGRFAAEQVALVAGLCGGSKEVLALEVGWPKRGDRNGVAVPGLLEQKVAVRGMLSALGRQASFVGFEDDGWRDPGDFGVEGAWGCAELF
ncbi:hypothetical protein MBLNU457_7748t1 [Dothideomycetes sp. NU457]